MTVLGIIGLIYFIYRLGKESIENADMRESARRRGDKVYASNRGGLRFVNNDHLAMSEYDPKTKEFVWKDLGK